MDPSLLFLATDYVDILFKVIGGGLLTISLGVTSWMLLQIINLRERVAVGEEGDKQERQTFEQRLADMKDERERRFKEVKDEVAHLRTQQEASNNQLFTELKDMNSKMTEMQQALTVLSHQKKDRDE